MNKLNLHHTNTSRRHNGIIQLLAELCAELESIINEIDAKRSKVFYQYSHERNVFVDEYKDVRAAYRYAMQQKEYFDAIAGTYNTECDEEVGEKVA